VSSPIRKEVEWRCMYDDEKVLEEVCRADKDTLLLLSSNVQIFTCGITAVADGLKRACIRLYEEVLGSYSAAVEAFAKVQKEHYATDIFG